MILLGAGGDERGWKVDADPRPLIGYTEIMNVIVVVCNSLHLGFLGAYGNAWIETPSLDRLAAEGVVFDHHFPENLTTAADPAELVDRPIWVRRPRSGLDAAPARRADLARHPLGPGGAHRLHLGRPAAPRDRYGLRARVRRSHLGARSGLRSVDPADGSPGRQVRLADEPGLRLPPEDDPEHALWKARWEQFLRNRAVLRGDDRRGEHGRRPHGEDRHRLARAARAVEKEPFMLWLDLFSPHGPWDPPQPYRDQYVTVEPDEFEAGEEGDLVEESDDDDEEIDIEDVAALIDVPAGAVGDVLSEAELFRLRRTYAGTVTLVDRWLGELFEAMRRMGRMDDTLVIFTSDQGEPLGEHGFVRRFRPWLYEELIHTPLIIRMPGGRARRDPAPGAGADGGHLADDRCRPWVCRRSAMTSSRSTGTTCSP